MPKGWFEVTIKSTGKKSAVAIAHVALVNNLGTNARIVFVAGTFIEVSESYEDIMGMVYT